MALARARIMGACYLYYLMADSREGQIKEAEITCAAPSSQPVRGNIRHGFAYERVPHITLKSIANNAEIDVIWEEWQAKLEPLRESLNATLKKTWTEWEIPREADAKWPDAASKLHAEWWQARIARQKEIDASIAAKAEFALRILALDGWSESSIGAGAILQHVIDAIEIQDNRTYLTNNLCFWQNRFGHANRDHRALLEAVSSAKSRRELEQLLFGLYRGDANEGATFDRLSELTGAKYPLLAYVYFLKDLDRFMPIQPTTFDRAFRDLGIELVTLRNCSWENCQRFNAALGEVRNALASIDGLSKVRPIDAHSILLVTRTA
jgi:hypothetical protein